MMQVFMKKKGYISSGGTLMVKTKQIDWDNIDSFADFITTLMEETQEGDKKKPEVEYVSGHGQHIFTFNGKKIYFHQFVEQNVVVGWEKRSLDIEYIHLSTFG